MTFLCNKVYMYRKVCTYVLISQMSNCSEKSQKSCRLIYLCHSRSDETLCLYCDSSITVVD